MQFLRGNVVTRVALLFPAVHSWVGLQQFSALAQVGVWIQGA